MKKYQRVMIIYSVIFLLTFFIFSYTSANSATIWTTDFYGILKTDFAPEQIVYIHGSSFLANNIVDISVTRPDGRVDTGSTLIDDSGNFVYEYQLNGIYGTYYVIATEGTNIAQTTFTDAPPAGDLDQCKNGGVGNPPISPCDWVNENLNENHAHYREGESVPYRISLTNIPITGVANCTLSGPMDCWIVIGYDIRHSSKNALDYLTHFQRINESVNPCSGISTCILGNQKTIPMPNGTPQPQNSFNALSSGEKLITIYNGNITNVSYVSQGSLTDANSETVVNITFRANSSTLVIAWGGHIASRLDWGEGNSAGGISGSPYHMRFEELCTPDLDNKGKIILNCGGGNQDRSLSAQAVSAPPKGNITIVKNTVPDDAQDFEFSRSFGTNFFLDDDGTLNNPLNSTITFIDLTPSSYNVTEILPVAGFSLTSLTCVDSDGGTTTNLGLGTAYIDLDANETVTCTYTNTKLCDSYTDEISCENNGCYWCDSCDNPFKNIYWPNGNCVDSSLDCLWDGCEKDCGADCEVDADCQSYCNGNIRNYDGDCTVSCTCSYSTENCTAYTDCYVYGNGCEDRDYYCTPGMCDYTYSNRHTDYHDDFVNYCSADTIRKHRQLHDFFCNGLCSDHTSWVNDSLVENCNLQDGWYNTTNTQWVDVDQCNEKEQIQQEYRDYTCVENAGVECDYTVTNTQWIDTGNTRYKPDHTLCDDGQYCTVNDECLSGQCAGYLRDCSYLNDQCNDGICNEEFDRCEYDPFQTSTPCNNGIYCDGSDHCDATGAGGLTPALCVNLGPEINCSYLNGQCQEGMCNEGLDTCIPDYTNYPLSTSCEADDDVCTVDHCDGSGSCVYWKDLPPDDPDYCLYCNHCGDGIVNCGEECDKTLPSDKRCLPEGTVIYYCINQTSYETPKFDTCKDTCLWDNCTTKIVTVNDTRCTPLPPPKCTWRNMSLCLGYNRPTTTTIPSFGFLNPPSFSFPKFDFSYLFRR